MDQFLLSHLNIPVDGRQPLVSLVPREYPVEETFNNTIMLTTQTFNFCGQALDPEDRLIALGSVPSAVEATALEFGMFIAGAAVYASYVVQKRKAGRSHTA